MDDGGLAYPVLQHPTVQGHLWTVQANYGLSPRPHSTEKTRNPRTFQACKSSHLISTTPWPHRHGSYWEGHTGSWVAPESPRTGSCLLLRPHTSTHVSLSRNSPGAVGPREQRLRSTGAKPRALFFWTMLTKNSVQARQLLMLNL